MNKLKDLNAINETKDNEMAIIYFTGMDCGACEAIKKKLEDILLKYPKIVSGEINGEENISVAAAFGVFTLPLFILYIEGKETLRFGRNIDLLEVERKISRYYNMIF